jgi:hypothetical protein
MEPDDNKVGARETGETHAHKIVVTPSQEFAKEVAEQKAEAASAEAVAEPVDEQDYDAPPPSHDSFSQVPVPERPHPMYDPSLGPRTSAYQLTQLPKGVYIFGFLGVLASGIAITTTISPLKVIVAVVFLILAIGLMMRFKTARYVTIGVAVLAVILSVSILLGIGSLKSTEDKSYKKEQQANAIAAANNYGSSTPTSYGNIITTDERNQHAAKLNKIKAEETDAIINVVFYSVEAIYILSPGVATAFNS